MRTRFLEKIQGGDERNLRETPFAGCLRGIANFQMGGDCNNDRLSAAMADPAE